MLKYADLKKTAKDRLKSYHRKAVLVCLIVIVLESLPMLFNNTRIVDFLNQRVNIDTNFTGDGIQNYFLYCTDILTPDGPLETILSDLPLLGWVLAYIGIRFVLTHLILSPLKVGQCSFFYRNRFEANDLDELVYAFDKKHYMNIAKTQLVSYIHIWFYTLCLIIPGIVYSFSYALVPYILAENPLMSTKEALNLSKSMTEGHKKEMFSYSLSFIGWYILGTTTFGISDIVYGMPYRQAADAEVYEELKRIYNKRIECVDIK